MGYYANWGGYIKFKQKPDQKILDDLNYVLHCDYFDEEKLEADYSGYEKYYEDEVYKVLKSVEDITEKGEIDFNGDDDCNWRFIFRNNEWTDEAGYIFYESELPEIISKKETPEFIGEIVDVFEDTLNKYKIGNSEKNIFEGEVYKTAVKKLSNLLKGWNVIHET